jgi:hypothetical protein
MNVNVGTANNDDYATTTVNATYDKVTGNPVMAPYKDLPMRLADTDQVQPDTWGQSDEGFKDWAAQELEVTGTDSDGQPVEDAVLPGEWNFYGSMGIDMQFTIPEGMTGAGDTSYVTVASAQTGPSTFYKTAAEAGSAPNADSIAPFIGAQLSYQKRTDYQHSSAMIIDCSQEGSSQSSMVICDNLMLRKPDNTILMSRNIDANTGNYTGGGQPSMARTGWLNFQRNTNFPGPGGAAGTFQHVVLFEDGLEYTALLDYFQKNRPAGETRPIKGAVYRWTLFRCSSQFRSDLAKLKEIYAQGGVNPAVGTLVGTIAPWYEGDQMEPQAMGRLLQPFSTAGFAPNSSPGTFKLPEGSNGNGAKGGFRLAPMVVGVNGTTLSIDVSNTFPETYSDPDSFDAYQDDTIVSKTSNPKYDLGTVTLKLTNGGNSWDLGTLSFDSSGTVSYGTEAFYTEGGMVDIPLSMNGYTADDLAEGDLTVVNASGETYLYEAELMVMSKQSTAYCEQEPKGGSTSQYNYAGTQQPVELTIYKKGRPITEAEYAAMVAAGNGLVAYTWRLNPLELIGTTNALPTAKDDVTSLNFQLNTDVTTAGTNVVGVFFKGKTPLMGGPFEEQGKLDYMVNPLVYIRKLPNEDFSRYYEQPVASPPVGNETLHFGVIYEKIFRNYFLLYPVMSQMVPMNDPQEWANPNMAKKLLERIENTNWLSYQYMPRTRDLSRSRTELLQAFCNAIIKYPERYVKP